MNADPSEKVIRCPYCDSDDNVDGDVFSLGPLKFVPDGLPRDRPASFASVSACMCLRCGKIWLWGDRRAVKREIGRIPTLPGG